MTWEPSLPDAPVATGRWTFDESTIHVVDVASGVDKTVYASGHYQVAGWTTSGTWFTGPPGNGVPILFDDGTGSPKQVATTSGPVGTFFSLAGPCQPPA